jgi:hypothetical protein
LRGLGLCVGGVGIERSILRRNRIGSGLVGVDGRSWRGGAGWLDRLARLAGVSCRFLIERRIALIDPVDIALHIALQLIAGIAGNGLGVGFD